MRELTDGSTAIVRGALDAGCDFFAGYPITPASPILMMMMRELPRRGGMAIQGEDEIASIGMCIGATMSGARAMTATSGPGISLYSENIGLAIMGEVPLVIVDVQRMGPATGGATTTGQGDVQFVRWGTGGGYPIIALAPSSVPECYTLTMDAFDLAERFRCPVFLMTDKELNLTATTVEVDGWRAVPVRERPARAAGGDAPLPPYRYDPPADVPPLAHYGAGEVVRFTGSTHDERAFITKDRATVERLNRHLAAKIDDHGDEIERVTLDRQPGATTLWIAYGSTAGAMRAAAAAARATGRAVSTLTVQSLWPVPERAIREALAGIERVVVAELNHGQYRREVERVAAGRVAVSGLHRIDGELIAPEQFLEAAA
ncbi:MAG: pyruvate flavodoxin/ferredoxin oxidoreductase [Acidobacteriota bacterium]|nr:pyruvate flavodoxin/ferredoxin oxidoreductase [Acidobacteriota bacterium]MDH3523318.1 pyruvate flavodoxin/ferredoxin oxidoreductase [Acidobacteriota bacterium]